MGIHGIKLREYFNITIANRYIVNLVIFNKHRSRGGALKAVWQNIFLIGGQDLTVNGVSKLKVDMIFIIFREFNMIL